MNEPIKLINGPQSLFMLTAGLDVLHAECREWQSDIAFWLDEAVFLRNRIRDKSHGLLSDTINHELHIKERELDAITERELTAFYKTVKEHEAYLATILEGQSNDQESYRQKHMGLKQSILRFEARFRDFKKELFGMLEQATILHNNISAHYWKAYTNFERHKAFADVSEIIGRYGNLKDTHMFSDIDISFVIELPGNSVKDLYSALSGYLKLEEEKVEVLEADQNCKILLNLTLTEATGNLKLEPGEEDI